MKIQDSIPPFDLPLGEELRNKEVGWFATDTLRQYRAQGRRADYGENDITYRFNRHGYRCPEFDVAADLRILSIGCEPTFGVGLPQSALYHERLAGRLEEDLKRRVVNWNLAAAGASNDYICRVLLLALPRLNPDLVLVQFAPLPRREYFTVLNERFFYVPETVPQDAVGREIHGHFTTLSNRLDDRLNFFRNYKTVATLLRGRNWLFWLSGAGEELGSVAARLDQDRLLGSFPRLDQARDGINPGRQSQEACFESSWRRWVEAGALQNL
jgi:hypothetical protein